MDGPDTDLILLTGATGFVGSSLLESLAGAHRVRCLVRDGSKIDESENVEVVEADLGEPEGLPAAFAGARSAYYLVHSMEPDSGNFADADREAAENFSAAAQGAGIERVIYLGGISGGDDGESEHLQSREEVEKILAEAAHEFVALRASMVVGAGSSSFTSMVQLVDRLPVLLMPSWRDRRSQPVDIADVVRALEIALTVDPGRYEIAGPDTISFEQMTEVVARLLGRNHRSLPLPFSNSRAEGAAAAVVTDADSALLEPLMAGLHSDLLVETNALVETFGLEPTGFEQAAGVAIEGMREAGAV